MFLARLCHLRKIKVFKQGRQLLTKVTGDDHSFIHTGLAQYAQVAVNQRLTAHLDQCLGLTAQSPALASSE
jgi:hypothetical protein